MHVCQLVSYPLKIVHKNKFKSQKTDNYATIVMITDTILRRYYKQMTLSFQNIHNYYIFLLQMYNCTSYNLYHVF